MSITINNKTHKPYLGNKEVSEVWLGDKKIYPSVISGYVITTDNNKQINLKKI